jgi:glycerophosphoryl diester phosphodiesterase
VRVVVRGAEVEGYLEGRRVFQSLFCVDRTTGCVGLAISGARVKFDDFVLRRLPDSPAELTSVKRPSARCEVIAHRGFSAVAPENTLASIAKAIEAGADGCEFDVYASKDGHIVLMHDETVDRTTNGRGKVVELTLAELKEALELLRRSSCRAMIEIKPPNITRQVVEAVRTAGMSRQAVLISFHASVIREARELAPEIPAAWVFGKSLEGTPEQQADQLAQQAAECRTDIVDLNFETVNPDLIAQLHRRGLKVWVWTVNEPVVMQVLRDWGVDAMTTDEPALARKTLTNPKPPLLETPKSE